MAEMQLNQSTGELPVRGMSILQRVKGIIMSPGSTMESIVEKPKILFPLLLTALSMLLLHLARFSLYKDYLRQSLIDSQGFMESLGVAMTPEMIEASISSSFLRELITTPLGSLFMWLMTTVIFFALFKIFGSKGKFKQFMSITGHAYIITALYYLIVLAASFLTGSLHVDLPLTSLANLLPGGMSGSFIYGVARSIDVFSIWYYSVIAIGFATVSGFKKRNTYIIVAAVFIAGLLISGSMELARSAITGA